METTPAASPNTGKENGHRSLGRKGSLVQRRRREGIHVGCREEKPLDREREYQQNIYESLRNFGFNDPAEACRNDSSKC